MKYTLSTHLSSETSYSPFELEFGMQDILYTDLLKGVKVFGPQQMILLQRLVDDIAKIRVVNTDYQHALDQERIGSQDLAKQNKYREGDLSLLLRCLPDIRVLIELLVRSK